MSHGVRARHGRVARAGPPSRTLDPRTYELRELGDTWAVARESTPRSPFWVVVRYDWSDPALITWTVLESSYGGGGEGQLRIEPGANGGSHVTARWNGTDARRQRLLLAMVHKGPMHRVVARLWASTLDDYGRADGK